LAVGNLELGVALESLVPEKDADEYVVVAREAEALGFAGLFASDHVIETMGRSFMEPLTLLANLAGATQRIRLGTSVMVLPYRNPVVLAAQAATLDRLSGGRLILTLAAGWQAAEFAAVGVDPAERGLRTNEYLEVMKQLFQGKPVHYRGRFTNLQGARIGVVPATPGGPPIWVGGDSEAALTRVVRFGEAWHGYDLSGLQQVQARLEAIAAKLGRDAEQIKITGVITLDDKQDPAKLASYLDQLSRQGVQMCSLSLPPGATATRRAMHWVAEQVVPLTQAVHLNR
jgi:probable F420-dependent oxidoreductase